MFRQLLAVDFQLRFVSEIGIRIDFAAEPASRLCPCDWPDFHLPVFSPAHPQIQFRARTEQNRFRRMDVKHIRRRVQLTQPFIHIQRLIGTRLYLCSRQHHLKNIAVDYMLFCLSNHFLIFRLISVGCACRRGG